MPSGTAQAKGITIMRIVYTINIYNKQKQVHLKDVPVFLGGFACQLQLNFKCPKF